MEIYLYKFIRGKKENKNLFFETFYVTNFNNDSKTEIKEYSNLESLAEMIGNYISNSGEDIIIKNNLPDYVGVLSVKGSVDLYKSLSESELEFIQKSLLKRPIFRIVKD